MAETFGHAFSAVAAGLASFYVGVEEGEMLRSLYEICAEFETELAEKFGPDAAAMIVQAFAAAVIRHREEIEAQGGEPPSVALN